MNISNENTSTFSLACLLSQTFSRNVQSDNVGFQDFVNLSEIDRKRRKLLRRNKQIFFDILLKKTDVRQAARRDLPVKDRITAAAFDKRSSKETEKLLNLFEKLPENNSEVYRVLEFILNLENCLLPPINEGPASIGDSISDYGSRAGRYQEFPKTAFEIRLPDEARSSSQSYKSFSSKSFQLDLSYSSASVFSRPRLGLASPVAETAGCEEGQEGQGGQEGREAADEGYDSPCLSPLDLWEEIVSAPACYRATWESLPRKIAQREKPFLSEAGPECVHHVWRFGGSIASVTTDL